MASTLTFHSSLIPSWHLGEDDLASSMLLWVPQDFELIRSLVSMLFELWRLIVPCCGSSRWIFRSSSICLIHPFFGCSALDSTLGWTFPPEDLCGIQFASILHVSKHFTLLTRSLKQFLKAEALSSLHFVCFCIVSYSISIAFENVLNLDFHSL